MGATKSRMVTEHDHPLSSRLPDEVVGDAAAFYDRQNSGNAVGTKLENVVDKETFLRGAQLARDRTNEAGVPGLTKVEYDALRVERTSNLFQQTKDLKVTILVTACSAITQGWQQSSINASSLSWKNEFRKDSDPKFWDNNQILGGLIDAAPWLSGSLIGTWLSDPLQEGLFGRRPALFASGIFCTAFVLATARCNDWPEFLVCRFLLGIGIGAKASVAPVFAAEAAIDHLRGRLLMMWQLFDAFGIFIGFACVFIVDMNWRVVLGTAAIPSIILLFLVFLCPESPRFLIRRKQYGDAFLSLRHLRGSDIQACRDLFYIHCQLQFEAKQRLGLEHDAWLRSEIYQEVELTSSNFLKRVWGLWTINRNRRACVAACIVMAAQQFCGVNVLAFYSSVIYADVSSNGEDRGGPKLNDTRVAWLNFGWGLANFLFTIPAYWVIDGYYQKGRRLLLLISLGGMFFTLVAISSFYFIEDDKAREGLFAFFTIVVFLLLYGIGAGPVPFTFSAEVFPLAFREVGMSFSVMVNFLGLGLLVTFDIELTICSALDALAFTLVFLFVPSTGQVALEDMNYIFEKKTMEQVRDHFAMFSFGRPIEDSGPGEIPIGRITARTTETSDDSRAAYAV
ncbi:hypothetical protein BDV18DRAFT_154357 [Aspergillus unguis]